MRYALALAGIAVSAVVAFSAGGACAEEFSARLSGFQEIGGLGAGETGAILSDATGTLKVDLDKKAGTLTYTLSYTPGLSSAVRFAHIHFGKVHVAGGVIAFLCIAPGETPPAGAPKPPACPQPSGSVSGTLTKADVIGPTAQNVDVGIFDGLEDAITSNTAYANVHTVKFGAGEIRGQIRAAEKQNDHDRTN